MEFKRKDPMETLEKVVQTGECATCGTRSIRGKASTFYQVPVDGGLKPVCVRCWSRAGRDLATMVRWLKGEKI